MDEDDSRFGGASTSRRVASRPRGDGRSRWVAVLAVAALVGVGVVLTRGGGDDQTTSERPEGEAGEPTTSGAEMDVVETDEVSEAYAEAAVRFGRAHTFGYRGSVRSDAANALRPGPWLAGEAAVEGAVHLPLSITTELAVDSTGAAAETVTSGTTTWVRRASAFEGLAAAAWESTGDDLSTETSDRIVPGPPSRQGMALLVDAIQAATDRREASRDDAGRRIIRATVPEDLSARSPLADIVDVIGGAELAVSVDDGGDIARVELTSAAGHPPLEIALDILRLGDTALVTAGDLAEPIRATLPPDVLTEMGLGSLNLPGLPTTWALTRASVQRPDGSLGPGSIGCGGPVLALEYHDLRAVADGWLLLWVWRDTCDPETHVGTGDRAEVPLVAGRFTGSATQTPGQRYQAYQGGVTDGTTAVSFATDLSLEATAAALGSLMPG